MGPSSLGDDGGRRGRVGRVGVRVEVGGILMVPLALRFLGVGGASDSSSVKAASGLGFGFVSVRLRLRFRGGFGMVRWIQRRSAGRQ